MIRWRRRWWGASWMVCWKGRAAGPAFRWVPLPLTISQPCTSYNLPSDWSVSRWPSFQPLIQWWCTSGTRRRTNVSESSIWPCWVATVLSPCRMRRFPLVRWSFKLRFQPPAFQPRSRMYLLYCKRAWSERNVYSMFFLPVWHHGPFPAAGLAPSVQK